MNIFRKNLTANFERNLKITSKLFLIVLTLGTICFAQGINDDLKSKTPPVKTNSKPAKTVKSTKNPKQSVNKPKPSKIKSVKPAPSNTAASETPDQIINRFMNFQQTNGVTDRDWKSVIAQTEKILQSNPNNATAKAQSLIAQGQLAFNQGNYAMAMTQFKAVLQILPQSSLPHYTLGKTYLANGQAEAAEKSFKTAIDQNENFALAYKGMGDALTAQGEKKKALKYFKKATEISVKDGNMPL